MPYGLCQERMSEESESLGPRIIFKIYLKFARVLQRLFLSVSSVTRVVYFHVNVTCFAAKHFKFDSHYRT